MRHINVDPDAKLARVGPGCLLKDVDRATQEHGLATVLGFISEVGVVTSFAAASSEPIQGVRAVEAIPLVSRP